MSKLKIFITFSVILLSFPSWSAQTIYDRAFITQLAKEAVEQYISPPEQGKTVITPSSIDPRVNIRPCSEPLRANIPENYSSRNVNVKISCSGSTPWKLFLPVKVSTQIPVIVATRKINKGSRLTEDNISIEWRDLYKTRGEVLENPQDLYGAKSSRNISQGKVLTKRMFCVVCKGESVTIIAKSNNFMIKTAGVALKNASFGQQVPVKNSRSGRTVTAQVKTINQVVIHL